MTATGLLAEEMDIARLDSDLYMDSVLLIGDEHLDDVISKNEREICIIYGDFFFRIPKRHNHFEK